MPRFYHKQPTATPPQVAGMPLNALRSQLYPVYPDIGDEIAAQQGRPLPIGLPQRMLFNHHKSGSAAVTVTSSVEGYVSARDFGDKHSGVLISAAGIPPVIMSPASFATTNGATALKPINIDPEIYRRPVARGYLPPDRYVSATDLRRFVEQEPAARVEAQQDARVRVSQAYREVNAVRSAIVDRVRGRR